MPVRSVDDMEAATVVGAGGMGRDIAAVIALSGYSVTLQDIEPDQLDAAEKHIEWSYSRTVDHGAATQDETDAALDRISYTDSLEEAAECIDFSIEAVVEQQSIKVDVFETLDENAPDHALLATNTSGLNITHLAESTSRPDQVIGLHWFNPPMLMDLVEVIMTEHTPESVADVGEALVESFGKTPIRCKRDIPNFIVNRLMRPFGGTAAWLAYLEEAGIEEIDSAMKYREGFPMGPFELTDYTGGIQIRVEGEQDHLNDPRPLSYKSRVCPLVHDLYEQGHYGRKSGQGYYDYSEQDEPDISEEAGKDFDTMLVWAPIINEAAKMVQHDVASPNDIDTGAKLGGNWPMGPLEKADDVGLELVVRKCVEYGHILNRETSSTYFPNLTESLPCDLLVEKAQNDETFY